MSRTSIALIILAIAATMLVACDKAPSGVIKESDMAHVIADFAVAEELMNQYPDRFPDDSAKLVLKQSILEKYDADLAKYDASLVWYAHNLKIYTEVHEKAIKILEKEGGLQEDGTTSTSMTANMGSERRVFPNSGDSANVWNEPKQWVLTSAMSKGYITFDYAPDAECRNGDLYSLNMKMVSNNSIIKLLLAIDYYDGCTGYINRTASVYGWSHYNIQADSTRKIKRIYGYIQYNIKPKGMAFIDSIYILRTHLDRDKYNMIGVQRFAASKAIREREEQQRKLQGEQQQSVGVKVPEQSDDRPPKAVNFPGRNPNLPRPQSPNSRAFPHLPKRQLDRPSTPSRDRTASSNGDHTPLPPIR